ncbi:hypothetical protein [Granulicella aggregans]|uniref:hypothetical protein n=1 Tax=Granulicella aggregans TaxID=474949 RepID=UPI0021E07779|nr:hypothetical protein [Granulicella aggregans]
MSEALHSFLVSVSCIIGAAILIPGIEALVRRIRRTDARTESPQVIQLTPVRSQRRSTF